MNTLSNIDITQILHNYGITINGVISKDLLPCILKDGWTIVNLENHDEGGGTHWVCFFKGRKSIYFDSFGFDAPEHLHKTLGIYEFNNKEIQNIDSSACGYFCIALIKYCSSSSYNKAQMMKRFCAQFSRNTVLNDSILRHFL